MSAEGLEPQITGRWVISGGNACKKLGVARQMKTQLIAADRLHLEHSVACEMHRERPIGSFPLIQLRLDPGAENRRIAFRFSSVVTLKLVPSATV